MSRASRTAALGLAALVFARSARGFLGVADTSFVTVIANPAEAANWASELERLDSQLAAANGTLQTVSEIRAYAGDPRAAVGVMPDLSALAGAVGALSSGSQTEAEVLQAWQAQGTAQRLLGAATLLQESGPGSTMEVFGQSQSRDPAIYLRFARDADSSDALRGQIADEQSARTSVASELALAWNRFRVATTESGKQAALTEISQLQSQNQVLDTRRRALLDDLALSDRQDRTQAEVRSRAADEQMLAQSALLNASTEGRALGAEAQRMATLQKSAPSALQADYTGLKLWTTADTGSPVP
jgi:hypothetical protein